MAISSAQTETIRRALAAENPAATKGLLRLVVDDLAQVEADIARTRPNYAREEDFRWHAGNLIVRRDHLAALIDDPKADLLAYAREQFEIAHEDMVRLRGWYVSESEIIRRCGKQLARLERCEAIVSQAEAAR
ncbi:hypothetical protein V5F40_06820 [Xanthobacter sp. DSM 14520]|uniref:hypothetical protein n=1 Tax=Xanthobacter autotrophicus (strain ATCC BAA-1158 / Py2) TaxID=78245 RepID=UPI003727ED43